MSTYFIAKDVNMLNILPDVGLSHYEEYGRFIGLSSWQLILQVVGCIYFFSPKVNEKVLVD